MKWIVVLEIFFLVILAFSVVVIAKIPFKIDSLYWKIISWLNPKGRAVLGTAIDENGTMELVFIEWDASKRQIQIYGETNEEKKIYKDNPKDLGLRITLFNILTEKAQYSIKRTN